MSIDPRELLWREIVRMHARTAMVRTFERLAEVGREAAQSLKHMGEVMNTPEWQQWMAKERRRERYLRRYARGPR